MTETHSFGYWVRRRRKALDLTQAELAGRVGCAEVTIRRIEADERRPSRQIADRLADQLQIPADERTAFLKAARAELAADRLPAFALPTAAPAADQSAHAPHLPGGTVTFLFTDIEGSTRLWEQHRAAMPDALARHETILREAITANGGAVFKTVGDSLCAVFTSAPQALAAALKSQRALHSAAWGDIGPLRVRMTLHTGTAEVREGEYQGLALSRTTRILSAGHGGQVLLSASTWELVRNHLPPGAELLDLGAQRLKDLSRPERIFQLVAPGLPTDFPALQTLDARLNNLPGQPTALIGREREVAAVIGLLCRADVRLVTLTGAGGTGKTRLALQAAAELLAAASPPLPSQWERAAGGEGHFLDGVWFVNLAPISDPELVISAIAQALGVPESGGRPLLDSVKSYLREKRILLLLDNFEQVLNAAPLVAELLAATAGLRVLATSRAALRLYGEHEFAVPPLALPPTTDDRRPTTGDSDSLARAETIGQYAAVQLFIDRAQAARSDFAVTNANAPAVAEICYRLDGLPLAIELAAARAKLFSPEALLARLGNRLQVLAGGPRDLPARQQTLRNTLDWSYDLLSAEEQALFWRLGVFVGGCTLEAAEAVCADQRPEVEDRGSRMAVRSSILDPRSSILDGLATLVDQSLLRREEGVDSEPRFVMLETVREYALERLGESGEEAALRRQHAEYFVALAEAAELELWGPQQVQWLQRLEIEHDNFRATLEWSHRDADTSDIGVRLAVALGWFWLWRGYRQEGYTHLRDAVDSAIEPTRLRARALHGLGMLVLESDIKPARALFEESLAISRALDDVQGQADALYGLGWVADLLSGAPPPDSYFDECLALYQQIGNTLGIARVLGVTGGRERYEASLALYRSVGHLRGCADVLTHLSRMAHHQGDDGDAIVLLQEALDLYCQLEDDGGKLWTFLGLSDIYQATGDYERAEALAEESVVLARKLNDRLALAWALNNLGEILLRRNEFIQTSRLFDESLEIFREMNYQFGVWQSIIGRARIAVTSGKVVQAVQLCASIEAVSIAQNDPPSAWPPEHRSHYDRVTAATRAQLDAAAWAAGRAMTIEEAVAEALER